ncbi:hypothetical protein OROGR_028880 [Orobanche gracilis]
MVKILIEKDAKEIHSRYILSRWRKDVKHEHYLVLNCYEDLMSEDEAKQFDRLCSNFYEVAHYGQFSRKVCEGTKNKSSIEMMNTPSCEHGAISCNGNSFKFSFDLND